MRVFACTLLLVGCCLADKENRVDYVGRLKRELFRDYDKDLIPLMEDNKPVVLSVGMNMIKMDLTEQGELDFTAWPLFSWTDARLAWNTEEYHGVAELRIPAGRVWIPDVEIYNALEFGPGYFSNLIAQRTGTVLVYATGMVLYIPQVKAKVQCDEQKFGDWPWGEYDCSIKLGSWTYNGNMLNLTKHMEANFIVNENLVDNSPVVFTIDSFKENPLKTKFYPCCPNEPYPAMEYKFKIQRTHRLTPSGIEVNPNPAEPYPKTDFPTGA